MNTQKNDIVLQDCDTVAGSSQQLLSSLKNEKVFITGGTGFVGSWLAELIAFLNDSHGFGTSVTLVSRRASGFKLPAAHLAARSDIKIVENDVRNLMDIPNDISYIIHAAGTPDNRQHVSDPLKVMDAISRGTDAVLAAASRLTNIKKILNISSGLIYGAQPYTLEKIPETFLGGPSCDSIIAVYAEAKRFAEILCTAYRNQFKLPIVVARPFAFLGPYQMIDKPWAVNNFMRDSLSGGPIRILGNDNTVRSYMYAADMAFWLLRILAAGVPGMAYNVGSEKDITMKELAEKIANKFPKKIDIISEVSTNKNADKSRFVPDTQRARETLGLCETIELDDALRRTLLWYSAAQ